MIPERIRIAGFLSYREPQEANFADRTLWMLAGPNGSGKSAIFDALTFCLFGEHRGGKRQHARSLIHHDCDRLAIEFDFRIDEQLFRIQRTNSRQGRSSRQIFARTTRDRSQSAAWTPIAETDTERGFNRWINTNLAYNYETFTASVLLLQGRAESLIHAAPAQRHRLLSQIAGLERFEQFAIRAGQQLTRSQGVLRACRRQVAQAGPSDTIVVDSLRHRIELMQQHITQLQSDIESFTRLQDRSTRWHQLTRDIESLDSQLQQTTHQLAAARKSEDARRRSEQQSAQLRLLSDWLQRIDETQHCRTEIARLETIQESATIELRQYDDAMRDLERSIEACRRDMVEASAHDKHLAQRQVELSWACSSANRYLEARTRLRDTKKLREKLLEQVQLIHVRHANLTVQLAECRQQLPVVQQVVRESTESAARLEATVQRCHDQLDRFRSVIDEQYCPYCQQPLDPAHRNREQQRLSVELTELQGSLAKAQNARSAALENLQKLRTTHDLLQEEMVSRDHALKQRQAEIQNLERATTEWTEQSERARHELSQSLRGAEAGTDSEHIEHENPFSERDLQQLRSASEEVERTIAAVSQENNDRQQLLEKLLAEQRNVTGNRSHAAAELDRARKELARHQGQLAGHLKLQAAAKASVPPTDRHLSHAGLSQLVQDLAAACQEDSTALPAEYTCDELERRQQQQLARLETLQAERTRLMVDAPPADGQADRQLRLARKTLDQAEAHAVRLHTELGSATERGKHYQNAQRQLREAQRECRLWKRIEQLLGRDGLQRALLEHAESSIVQYANAVLDRLSNGQLYVSLSPPGPPNRHRPVLDLVARSTTTNSAWQELALLSGSQKFRVAVALSLAIGQFASGARRGVQAVIIDEGFGCLDATNRSAMIQELQNLCQHLDRILLVSHQDEFCSAFPDGYRCELVDGATRLTPFHA